MLHKKFTPFQWFGDYKKIKLLKKRVSVFQRNGNGKS